MSNAYRDENDVPTLIASSSTNGYTPVRLYADPTTHRLLVDISGATSVLIATGTVNGVNTQFTFSEQPDYIVSDHAWYAPTNSSGSTNWTWNAGTLTATMTIPPTEDIFGIAIS